MEQHPDSIIQELFTPETKKSWYSRWWGIFLIVIILIFLIAGALFANRIVYFYQALKAGNNQAFEGIYVDASEYGKVGQQVSRIEVETFDDPYAGPVDAKVVVVEFSDFQCPYCLENYPTVKKMIAKYGDKVKFIYRDFPQEYLHPQSVIAAMAAQCANDQGLFWPYHDLLFASQNQYETEDDLITLASSLDLDNEKFSTCLTSHKYEAEVMQDLQDGIRFGLRGTPTFFINGVKLSGTVSEDVFDQLLSRFVNKYAN